MRIALSLTSLLLAASLTACGDQEPSTASDSNDGSASQASEPSTSATPTDDAPGDYYDLFENADVNLEELTVLLVAGATKDEVLGVLGAAPESTVEPEFEDVNSSSYAAVEVEGGVVAFEHTGYADPSPAVLAELSALGGSAAVSRSNIDGQERFGCARDGRLQFDANEFMFVEKAEKDAVPAELRELFDSAWIDLDSDVETDFPDDFVGYAMATAHTGVVVTSDDLRRAMDLGYHRVRSLTYLD